MLVLDLLHSCAHEEVAAAAVASIGGALAERVQAEAHANGVSIGKWAALAVKSFARDASDLDWQDLHDAVRGKDIPVLAGLAMILDHRPGSLRRRRDQPTISGAVIAATRQTQARLGR